MGVCVLQLSVFLSGNNPSQYTNYYKVRSSCTVLEQEPSFLSFCLGIKSLFGNSSLPAKTQRKLWGGMNNICLSYDLNIDMWLKNRKKKTQQVMGFIQFPVWRLFILTGQQEVWWNSNEEVFSYFSLPKVKLFFVHILLVIFITSFGAVVKVLLKIFIEK